MRGKDHRSQKERKRETRNRDKRARERERIGLGEIIEMSSTFLKRSYPGTAPLN